ncbi:MAG: CPBP family intramembrane metalloprotease [Candidatus Aminicenantes bacterium]|nr:CPBP family intramembrane metalloprotease [Candidatus Aminicenantes bacterium]
MGRVLRAEGRGPEFFAVGLAVLLFVPLFVFRRLGPLDFWWWMSANIVVLTALAARFDGGYLKALAADIREGAGRKAAWGVLSAAALYGLFWAGNKLARLVLPFAAGGIADVYAFKAGASVVRVVLLMALVIGPGEELVWRAFLQRRAQQRFGPGAGFLAAAALYALVHAGSGNPMLVLAAAVCGLFWGFLYLRTGSAVLVAVSHTLWDLAVFVLFPF